jgi:hypothetical protein
MSFIDEPILKALRVRKQGYRLAMAVTCGALAVGCLLGGAWYVAIPLAIVAVAKGINYATSNDPPEARYGD